MDTLARRLELLKLEGLGFSQAEIVKELSQKCACSCRTVYRDFETRKRWQSVVQSVVDAGKILLKVVNRYEQIYRQASVRLLTFTEEACQLGALNTMLKANATLCETVVLPELFSRLKALEDKAAKRCLCLESLGSEQENVFLRSRLRIHLRNRRNQNLQKAKVKDNDKK